MLRIGILNNQITERKEKYNYLLALEKAQETLYAEHIISENKVLTFSEIYNHLLDFSNISIFPNILLLLKRR